MSTETPAFLQTPDWQVAAVNLLQGPVFEHEGERWRRVSHGKADLNGYFKQIGLRVIVDPVEGYAYLEQLPDDELRDLPRIVRRRQLSLGATIYGFFLRQELDRAIKDDPNVARVRRNLRQIRELVAEFFPAFFAGVLVAAVAFIVSQFREDGGSSGAAPTVVVEASAPPVVESAPVLKTTVTPPVSAPPDPSVNFCWFPVQLT